ncbi:MAG: hypothetical protein ACJ8KX_09105 [Chthoniobacterales bacterium]
MKTNARRLSSLLLVAATLLFAGLIQTRADTPALSSFSNDGGRGTASDVTLGWDFTLSNSVTVTSLGVWDGNNGPTNPFGPEGDGLLTDHLVSIWTSTGSFVASVLVPAGGGTLLNGFRYAAIAPTFLAAGKHVIGAYYAVGNQDRNAALMTTITTAAGVTFGQPRADGGNAFPVGTLSGNGVFGPNFQFVTGRVGVPEGGSSATLLAISGLLICGAAMRHRRIATV